MIVLTHSLDVCTPMHHFADSLHLPTPSLPMAAAVVYIPRKQDLCRRLQRRLHARLHHRQTGFKPGADRRRHHRRFQRVLLGQRCDCQGVRWGQYSVCFVLFSDTYITDGCKFLDESVSSTWKFGSNAIGCSAGTPSISITAPLGIQSIYGTVPLVVSASGLQPGYTLAPRCRCVDECFQSASDILLYQE